jgi:phosphohistidine swiveling domain-containing protein
MRSKLTIAAAALFLIGAAAQAERAERDPDKMAVIAATILIFDRDCEKVSPKLEEAAGVATEVAGKPKVAAVIMRIENQIENDGKEAWCALARESFPLLTER